MPLDDPEFLPSNRKLYKFLRLFLNPPPFLLPQRSLDARRETYRPLAVSGSRLYFLLKSLPGLNRMYHFSLSAFLRLFKSVLSRNSVTTGTGETEGTGEDGTGSIVAGRIAELTDGLIQTVFGHVTRSLFKADRLTFGLHLAQVNVVIAPLWPVERYPHAA